MPPPRRTTSTRSLPTFGAAGVTAAGPKVIRTVTYRRASTDEENQPYSLDVQDTKLRAFIDSQDDMALVGDYVERASAKDIENRPQMLRLLEDAAAGKFDAVLVYKVDRWSRRLADLLATVDFLERHSVTFQSATEPIDSKTNLGKMVLQMLGSFAEFERGLIVERVTRGIEAKVAKGLPLTSVVGFGLRTNNTGVIEADPATFGVVQRIFTEYTEQRLGTKAIAMGLQADGLPAPGSAPWAAPAVARVLRNRTFIGELPFRDGWLDGAHPALLDTTMFDKAQALADERSQPSAAARSKGNFLLTGTMVCAHCAGAYIGTTGTSANKTKVRYYSCGTARRFGKAHCTAPSIPADELEALMTDALLDLYADGNLFTEAIAAHLDQREQQTGPLTAELAAANAAVTSKEGVLRRYRTDYESGALDAARYSKRAAELDEELLAARTRVAELELQLASADTPPLPSDAERQELHAALVTQVRTGSVPVRKALFAALVERVEVHAIDDIRPTFRIGGPGLVEDPSGPQTSGSAVQSATHGQPFASRASGWS